MTDKATMPEVICDACRTINIPAKHYHALADKANKYDSLAAVAGRMAEVLEAIERSNLQIPIDTQATQAYAFEVDAFKLLSASALTAYNALMKGR